jgi:hypothetical protein
MKCESCGKESTGMWSVCPACGATAGVVQSVVAVPVEAAREVAKGSVEVGTSVVKGTETVAHDLAEAGKQLGRSTEDAMTKVGDHLKPNAAPVAVAP